MFRLQIFYFVFVFFVISIFFVFSKSIVFFVHVFSIDNDVDVSSKSKRQFFFTCFFVDLFHFSIETNWRSKLIIDVDISNLLLSFEFVFELRLLQRVLHETNEQYDVNYQYVDFARQKTINQFDNFDDIVFFVISNNQFHLIFLTHVVIVFENDEQIAFVFLIIEILFIYEKKFEFARVLFSNLLHQRDQQIEKSIYRLHSFFDFVKIHNLLSMNKNSIIDKMIKQSINWIVYRLSFSFIVDKIMFDVCSNEIVV